MRSAQLGEWALGSASVLWGVRVGDGGMEGHRGGAGCVLCTSPGAVRHCTLFSLRIGWGFLTPVWHMHINYEPRALPDPFVSFNLFSVKGAQAAGSLTIRSDLHYFPCQFLCWTDPFQNCLRGVCTSAHKQGQQGSVPIKHEDYGVFYFISFRLSENI